MTSDLRPVTSGKVDPYATATHRRIDAILLLVCVGIFAVLAFSVQAQHKRTQPAALVAPESNVGGGSTTEKVAKP